MKVCGVIMVRNDSDIIEACVRHNLSLLDRLVVIDHGSFDGTSEILCQLAAENLPLSVVTDPSVEFQQGARMTQVVRAVILQEAADFVFTLDADEFLKTPSRAALEDALRQVPLGLHARVAWHTYIPDDLTLDAALFSPDRARHRLKTEPHAESKVVVARHFGQRPREWVSDGNHVVWNIDQPGVIPPHAPLPMAVVALAHVPVRSRRQLEKKIVIGYLAHLLANPNSPEMAYHWRDIYQEIRAGTTLDARRLREIACNYGLRRADWRPIEALELIADPLLTTVTCRYPPAADLGTLQLLMRFAERLTGSPPLPG